MLQNQKPFLLGNGNYLMPPQWDINEVYGHNDLCCLYTHSTSPLRRYIDIVVQRLILQSLKTDECTQYSYKELTRICKNCNTKTSNANKFQTEYNRLSIALSLANCSQSYTAYVTSVEKTLNFVIKELDYNCLSMDQRSFRLSSITSNAKPAAALKCNPQGDDQPESCKTYVWKAMVTSFSGKLFVNKGRGRSLVNATICKSTKLLDQDALLTFYVYNTECESAIANDYVEKALVQRCYTAEFSNNATTLGVEDWKTVTDFMKLPSQDTATPLKNLLGSCQPSNKDKDVFPSNISFCFYEMKRSFKIYEVLNCISQQTTEITSYPLVSSCWRLHQC